MTIENKRMIKVGIKTPYLYENMIEEGNSEDYVKKQIEKFGYDPENLLKESKIKAGKYDVELLTGIKECCPAHFIEDITNPNLDFVIIGSTEGIEMAVKESMGSGVLFARYSTFYGKESRYSGLTPEKTGYSFDIPKNPKTVRQLLSNERTLEAILSGSQTRIENAIAKLNTEFESPILITSYLPVALALKEFNKK